MAKEETVIKDQVLNDYMERAKAAQSLRKTAPVDVQVKGFAPVQQKVLIKQFAKDSGYPPDHKDGFHFMFGDRTLSGNYADQGYEPVIHNGRQVAFEGDPLWRIPTKLYRQDLTVVTRRSDHLLKQSTKDDATAQRANALSTGEEVERRKLTSAEIAAGSPAQTET